MSLLNQRVVGLGLAIAQNIVEQHDGQIYASNVKPHGARVTIEFSIIAKSKELKWKKKLLSEKY